MNNRPVLATEFKCTGCFSCVSACRTGALSMFLGSDGHFHVNFDYHNCVGCGMCEKCCPTVNGYSYGSNSKISIPYKAWNNNDNQRLKSSSGGVFSSIASNFLSIGEYVCGAVIDGIQVKHILTNNINDLYKLQGGKYLQSNIGSIYKQIAATLKEHKVLFSGTGCQVAGVKNYISHKCPDLINNFYSIDIVCDGVPSYNLLTRTLDNCQGSFNGIVSFRNKNNGWKNTPKQLTVKFGEEEICLGEDNLMINGFNKAFTNRYSCYDCQFAYSDRDSDITIGDFWGIEETEDNLHKGISLAIVHSNKGKELMGKANLTFKETSWYKAVKNNHRVFFGCKSGYNNSLIRRNMVFLFKKCSYKTLYKIFSGRKTSKYDLIGILCGFNMRIHSMINNINIKNALSVFLQNGK